LQNFIKREFNIWYVSETPEEKGREETTRFKEPD